MVDFFFSRKLVCINAPVIGKETCCYPILIFFLIFIFFSRRAERPESVRIGFVRGHWGLTFYLFIFLSSKSVCRGCSGVKTRRFNRPVSAFENNVVEAHGNLSSMVGE